MFYVCCALLYVHSSIARIMMGKRELVALLNLSSWCLVMVERLFLVVPRGCLWFVIVVFHDHTHSLFLSVNPFMPRLPCPYLMKVVPMNMSLQMTFHTPGICFMKCSPCMKCFKTRFGNLTIDMRYYNL